MVIVVDGMGSDLHPLPDVAGVVLAAQTWQDKLILVGDEAQLAPLLAQHGPLSHVELVHTPEKVTMEDKPSLVVRDKPHSSMHVGLQLVADGRADAFVSAGNTGAMLAIGMLATLKRQKGVKRPALAATFPLPHRPIILDAGANAECKPEHLAQFALMGHIYMEKVRQLQRPKIGLLANGEEEGKGTTLLQETRQLLAASPLNFVGNVEPHAFLQGSADILITDGFTGNIFIKTANAFAKLLMGALKEEIMGTTRTKLGGWLAQPAFARVRQQLNADSIGGAPLLGLNGVLIVAHGHSNEQAIFQAIGRAREAVQADLVGEIGRAFALGGNGV